MLGIKRSKPKLRVPRKSTKIQKDVQWAENHGGILPEKTTAQQQMRAGLENALIDWTRYKTEKDNLTAEVRRIRREKDQERTRADNFERDLRIAEERHQIEIDDQDRERER
ncbi:hypothetical protein DL768_011061 [Monosporascus sp. mg162]|nr:hypothetical protein DL768_011061 [Monosporascus sp. mg162]